MTQSRFHFGRAKIAWKWMVLAAVAVLSVLPGHAAAEGKWSGSATLYGWLTWLDLEADRGGASGTVDVSLDLGDVLDALQFAVFAAGDIHYGRVGILQDVVYSDLGFSGRLNGPFAAGVNIENKMLISTTALGYQVYAQDGKLLEPYAGARYVRSELDLKLRGGGPVGVGLNKFVDADWWDPVVGLRGRTPLTDKVSAVGFADIAGFGVGSEFSWQVYGGLDYALTDKLSANAGFRYLSIDYDADAADINLDIYGPVMGLTFRF